MVEEKMMDCLSRATGQMVARVAMKVEAGTFREMCAEIVFQSQQRRSA